MTILRIEKIHDSGNIGEGLRRVYEVEYRVYTNSVRVTMPEIAAHRDCPGYGDRYTGVDNLAFVSDINIERERPSRFHWLIKVTYDSEVKVSEDELNPLERRPKVSLVAEFDKTEPIRDRNGLLYCNAAGDPFQGVQIDIVKWKIRFKRNIPADFPKYILGCANKLNDAPVKIRGLTWAKNTLRVTGCEIGDEEQENGKWFSELSLEFTYDERLHRNFLLNQGFNEIDPLLKLSVGNKQYPFKKKVLIKGEPPAEPVFLDKNGSRIHEIKIVRGVKVAVYKEPPDPADVVVIQRDPYEEFPFNDLPLKY